MVRWLQRRIEPYVSIMTIRSAIAALLLTAITTSAQAQMPPSAADSRNLAEFEGVYDYRDGLVASIIAHGNGLVAIIAEGKYVLRAAGVDTFTNPGGQKIPFLRSAAGGVTAFREGSDTFARRTANVPALLRSSLEPRPLARDGTPERYRYSAPPQLNDGVRVAPAGDGALSAEIAAQLVNGVIGSAYPEVRSILLYHRGALRLEEYFYGYTRDRPHQMRSLTKSVVSLVAGAAIDRGLLQLNEPALAHLGFSEYANPDARKARVTLADLLSHQSGLACDDHSTTSPGNESKVYDTVDWMRTFVDLPMVADPGTVGRYCSAGIIASARVVERQAGVPLRDFADSVLFAPLGVRRADWSWDFALDRSGRNEFAQIHLRPRDMLKIGMLIAQQGEWEGRRVVSAEWIAQATAKRTRVDDSDYGLGIWHRWYNVVTPAGNRRVETIMLSGNGGQKVYLVPSLDLIAVFTGSAFNVESPVNDMMAKVLLPALLAESRTPPKR